MKVIYDVNENALLPTLEEKQALEIKELKAQIEKMACCNNCKHYDGDNYCKIRRCIIHTLEGSCDKWEVAE